MHPFPRSESAGLSLAIRARPEGTRTNAARSRAIATATVTKGTRRSQARRRHACQVVREGAPLGSIEDIFKDGGAEGFFFLEALNLTSQPCR